MNKLAIVCAALFTMSSQTMIETAQMLLNKHDIGFVLRTIRNNSTHKIRIVDTYNNLIMKLRPGNSADINKRFEDFEPLVGDVRKFQSGSFAFEFPGTDIDELWVASNFAIRNNTCEAEVFLNQMLLEAEVTRKLTSVKKVVRMSKVEGTRFFVDVDIESIIGQSRVSIHVLDKSGER